MCQILNIPYDYCLAAITELQTSALDKLKARDEFAQTGKRVSLSNWLESNSIYVVIYLHVALGLATLKVRVPNKNTGARLLTVQTKFDVPAEGLYENVANQLGISAAK